MTSGEGLELFRDLHSRAAERRAREAGLFFGESPTVVRRLIDAGVPIRHLVVSDRRRAFLDTVPEDTVRKVLAESELYDLVGFEMHRGVIATFERPPLVNISDLSASRCLVVLEGINDADNLGSLIRTAVALGVTDFVCDPTTADLYTRRCVRVSMGTVGAVSLSRSAVWPPSLGGRQLIAMSPSGVALGDGVSEPMAVAFGAEGAGLSQALLDVADVVVRIPMSNDVDSLNVSHAAAIALHHFSRCEPPRQGFR